MPTERVEASATTSLTGKLALGQDDKHLAPDIAGRADHRDFEACHHEEFLLAPPPRETSQRWPL